MLEGANLKNNFAKILTAISLLLMLSYSAVAGIGGSDDANSSDESMGQGAENNVPATNGGNTGSGITTRFSEPEIYLSIAVLIFGLILTILECIIIIKMNMGWNVDSIRIVGITLVVTAGLFLIPASYNNEQIAPLVGLLGTIVGYLLGKSSDEKDDLKSKKSGL